jgi:hypothetical protein
MMIKRILGEERNNGTETSIVILILCAKPHVLSDQTLKERQKC